MHMVVYQKVRSPCLPQQHTPKIESEFVSMGQISVVLIYLSKHQSDQSCWFPTSPSQVAKGESFSTLHYIDKNEQMNQ